MYQEGELNTVTIVHGTQSVLMDGIPVETKPEISAMLWATIIHTMVWQYPIKMLNYSHIITFFCLTQGSVLIDFGRGTSPILKLDNDCAIFSDAQNDCLVVKMNAEECVKVLGIDCKGKLAMHHFKEVHEFFFSSMCFKQPNQL